jgi:leucyl/phenylalanyl-tRNA---protein transferase
MPIEPPSTRWSLTAPPDDHPYDAVAHGADLEPGTLLAAYRLGLFPMPERGSLTWWSPARRAIFPLDGFYVSRSLRRARGRFETRINTAFGDVMRACADASRRGTWIDDQFIAAYTRLHELGWAHSVEAWDADGLAGGVYGVAVGGLFAAESMFYRRSDASKVALWTLVEQLLAAVEPDKRLLDAQWLTPHLASLGAVEISRRTYRERLAAALPLAPPALPLEWDGNPLGAAR